MHTRQGGSSRKTHPGILLVVLTLAGATFGCDRSLTSPVADEGRVTPPAGRHAAAWPTPGGSDNSPTGGSGPIITATSGHDGSQQEVLMPYYFRFRTIVQVTLVGTIHRQTVLGPFHFGDYGVTGTGAAPGDGAVFTRQQNSNDPAQAVPGGSFPAYFQDRIVYGRNGSAARPFNAKPSCGNPEIPNDPDCIVFSAVEGTQLTFSAYDVALSGTVDATSVSSHGLVRFDISPAQADIQGLAVPLDASEWLWTPDDPADGPPTLVACGGGRHCELFVDASGSMLARAYVNGKLHETPPMHVAVTDRLMLNVDKAYGPVNYRATFVARNSDSTNILVYGWTFVPDDGSASIGVQCPTGSQGSQWTCVYAVPKSGTMRIDASVHYNHVVKASSHVAVVPCPTGDSLLDDPSIRRMLDSIWKLSHGGDSNLDIRLERGFATWDSSGTRVIRLSPTDAQSTPCSTAIANVTPDPGRLEAEYHVHPFVRGDSLPKACEKGKSVPPGSYLRAGGEFVGPSLADWNRTALQPPRPEYVVDRDSIFRALPGVRQPYDSASDRFIPDPSDVRRFLTSWPRRGAGCLVVNF